MAARGASYCYNAALDTKNFSFIRVPASFFTGGPVEWVKSSGKGTVHTFSVIRRNYPEPYFEPFTPYVVAMIDVAEGVRMMSNVTGCALEDVNMAWRLRCILAA